MPDSIDIADIIESVSDGIREAARRSASKQKVLQLAECEVELAVKATTDGKGGLRFWIVEAGGSHAKEDSSRIKLKFMAAGLTQFVSAQKGLEADPPPDRQTQPLTSD